LSVGAILSLEDGQEVLPGDVLARIPREGAKTKDITGGLPRVAELFEARRPKDHAIIAEIDGYVRFGNDYKNKRRITIESAEDEDVKVEYMVPKGKHIPVQEGDFVQKGEYIMDGNPAPHDILAIMGVEALADYMIDEVQDVYRLQGVKINDKHIEVIVRQMLQKWEVHDSGDTTLLKGEQVDKVEFDEMNEKAIAKGLEPATGGPILFGLANASLPTRSFISAASFPGHHPGSDRGGDQGQPRQADRPEGRRHCRTFDACRDRGRTTRDQSYRAGSRRQDHRGKPCCI